MVKMDKIVARASPSPLLTAAESELAGSDSGHDTSTIEGSPRKKLRPTTHGTLLPTLLC